MQLLIDGVRHSFIPIRDYREQHGLPPEFGVALFEPKDYGGLGSIEGAEAGTALNMLRAAVLDAIPTSSAPGDLLTTAEALTSVFRTQMYALNPIVGLKAVEIEFAAAGFADVTQSYAYALLRAQLSRTEAPPFMSVYGAWLESSARVTTTVHDFSHGGAGWRVWVVSYAYGRAGLVVQRGDRIDYVADGALACPADGFMAGLLREVCEGLSTSPA